MNKQQYDELNAEQKALVTEAYIDGFRACVEQVKSNVLRIGDEMVDKLFISNRDMIVSNLSHSLEQLEKK